MKEQTCQELLDWMDRGDRESNLLAARVERVLARHQRVQGTFRAWCAECRDDDGIGLDWPCQTVRLLDG